MTGETEETTEQIAAAVHSRLIIDKLSSMNLSHEKRREILEKVIQTLKSQTEQNPPA